MTRRPVFIAVGSNMAGPGGPPRATIEAAACLLAQRGIRVVKRSRLYQTPPWGGVRQPVFLNAVWEVSTGLSPETVMARLLEVEQRLGRKRRVHWGARTLDLDLIAFGDLRCGGDFLALPHPRAAMRAFVLVPLSEIAPQWRLPGDGRTAGGLLSALGMRARAGVKVADFCARQRLSP